jgi:flagellar biosynthesis protein FlhG
MFSADRLRVIQVMAGRPGVGRMSVATHLGLALAKAGRDTLLMDVIEDGGQARALSFLGLEPRLQPQASHVASAIVPAPHGLAVLPLALEVRQAPARVAEITRYCASLEFALVTATSTFAAQLLPIERERREVVVVLSRAAASITEAYALIKRMSTAGVCRRFHVLVNRVDSDAEAALIFRNMAHVARGYLDVELGYLGFVPADAALERATALKRNVLDGWPDAPAALAFKKLARSIAAWPLPRAAWEHNERNRAARVGAA